MAAPLKIHGWRRQKLDHRDRKLTAYAINPAVPIDLRPKFQPVYDQGQVGSCVANATAGAFEYVRRSQSLPEWTPSRLFIYYATRELEGVNPMSDAGSECRDAIKVVTKIGVPPESIWPYDENNVNIAPDAEAYQDATHNLALKYDAVPQKLEHLLSCLTHNGPVIWGGSVFSAIQSEEVSRTGIVPMPAPDEQPIGGHSTLIVGWKPDTQQFWVRNSWGADWAIGGYCLFPAAYILNPDLASDFWVLWMSSRN